MHRVFEQEGLIARAILWPLITLDSCLLLGRVLIRRMRFSLAGGRRRGHPTSVPSPVLYIDCGVHKEGKQIRWMHRWFSKRYDLHILGFEAGSEHIADARSELADLEGVRLEHVALVGPEHTGNEVRLYIHEVAFRGSTR